MKEINQINNLFHATMTEIKQRQRDIEITTNTQKLSAIRPNIVNILILITALTKRITCESRPTNENFKENFARLWSSVLVVLVAHRPTDNYGNCVMHQINSSRASA